MGDSPASERGVNVDSLEEPTEVNLFHSSYTERYWISISKWHLLVTDSVPSLLPNKSDLESLKSNPGTLWNAQD